jgi:hypothetical protein
MLAMIAQWNIKLAATKPGSRAHLLEALDPGVESKV